MVDGPAERDTAADRPVDDGADATAVSEAAFDVAPELFGAADRAAPDGPGRPDDTAL